MGASTPAGKFSCDGCSKSYTWKAELAGRRVKCKCGNVMTVPASDPAAAMYEAPPEGFDDLYAFAQESAVQAAPEYAKPQAVGAPAAAGNGRAKARPAPAAAAAPPLPAAAAPARKSGGNSALAGYAAMGTKRGARPEPTRAENVYWNPVTDLYLPAGLIVLGMFLTFFEIRVVHSDLNTTVPGAIGAVFLLTVVNVVLGFAGILVATKILDLGLGPIPVALLKTAAAATLPAAVASLIGSMIPFGGILAWFISFALSLLIFIKLMDLDYFETCICTTIVWLIRTWVGYAILGAILNGMDIGGAGGTLIAAAGGTDTMAAAAAEKEDTEEKQSPAERYDERAQSLLEARRKPDAKTWAANPKHTFAKRTHEQTVKIVDDLAAMGAQFMVVPDPTVPGGKKAKDKEREVGHALVFLLPSTQEHRQKIFDYHGTLGKTFGPKDLKDEGQKYMAIQFSRGYFSDDDEDPADDANTPDAAPDDDDDE